MSITKVIEAADNLAKVAAIVSGRLDLDGSVNLYNLISICQSCRESLDNSVGEYLLAKKESLGEATECKTPVVGHFDFTKEAEEVEISHIKAFAQACKDSLGGTQTFKEG